jgi:hypothetical protein
MITTNKTSTIQNTGLGIPAILERFESFFSEFVVEMDVILTPHAKKEFLYKLQV